MIADIWYILYLVVFPMGFVLLTQYAFGSLVGNIVKFGDQQGGVFISYPVYVLTGIMAFNSVYFGEWAGYTVFNDRSTDMLKTLILMPYSKLYYLVANFLTTAIFAIVLNIIMFVVLRSFVSSSVSLSWNWLTSPIYILISILSMVLLHASIVSMIAVKVRPGATAFIGVTNIVYFFSGWANNVVFPSSLSNGLNLLYLNPTSFAADISRTAFFPSQITAWTNWECVIIVSMAVIALIIANRVVSNAYSKKC